jgi:hypothetical protein
MCIDSHDKGSERCHNREKKYAKENDIRKRMSQQELDK